MTIRHNKVWGIVVKSNTSVLEESVPQQNVSCQSIKKNATLLDQEESRVGNDPAQTDSNDLLVITIKSADQS